MYPSVQVLALSLEQSLAPAMVHPVCLMPVVLMIPLPIWALFHMYAHVAPPIVPIFVALPSPICATPVPFEVAPSTHATPSLFPPFLVSLSSFGHFACHVVASFPLWPKMLSPQVDLLGTCSFTLNPCDRKSSSFPCHALVCLPLLLLMLLLLSGMLLHVASLTIPQRSQLVHWIWINCSNISMGPPWPDEMLYGSI